MSEDDFWYCVTAYIKIMAMFFLTYTVVGAFATLCAVFGIFQ